MTSALGPFVQASSSLTQVVASPQSGAEVAVVTTIDITLLILGPILGAIVGVVVSVVLSALGRKALAKSATASSILRRIHQPAYFTFAAWGAWVGEGIALVNPGLSDWEGTSVTTFLMHILLVVGLAFLTWMAYAAAWVFEDAAKARQSADKGRSRRFETQAQVFRRLTQSIIVGVGIVAIIGTFEAARQAMTTLLASAGLLSVIVGLAAQQTLGNVFAGLQLAFTDAIRVGDVVVAGDKQETGSVEEITLSYVVVRIWDERRLIVPCRYFTTTPFENWTRRAAAQLGTVELKLDWTAPMSLIRAKVENLLDATDLWDGRNASNPARRSPSNTTTVANASRVWPPSSPESPARTRPRPPLVPPREETGAQRPNPPPAGRRPRHPVLRRTTRRQEFSTMPPTPHAWLPLAAKRSEPAGAPWPTASVPSPKAATRRMKHRSSPSPRCARSLRLLPGPPSRPPRPGPRLPSAGVSASSRGQRTPTNAPPPWKAPARRHTPSARPIPAGPATVERVEAAAPPSIQR